MAKKLKFVLLLVISLSVWTLSYANDRPAWPKYVWDSIAIPEKAEDVKYTYYADTYQITYSMGICFPSNDVINNMAALMIKKGWDRLYDDPLNPGEKLSIVANPKGMTYLSNPWEDYWRDSSGNVVWFGYRYDVGDVPIQLYEEELRKSCSLHGAVIFAPAEVFKRTQEVMQKALEERRKEQSKQNASGPGKDLTGDKKGD